MKKILAVMIALAMLLVPCAAFSEAEANTAAPWYELSAGNTVLTVNLPENTPAGFDWTFEISNPEALELLTQETADGMYTASFMTTAGGENSVSLILRCCDETGMPETAYTHVLELITGADNQIAVSAATTRAPFASWLEYGDDGYILTVRMPDANWSFEIVTPDVLELINSDDSDGVLTASFMATMENVGFAEIVFLSDDELQHRTIETFVNESGKLLVDWVETFEILE